MKSPFFVIVILFLMTTLFLPISSAQNLSSEMTVRVCTAYGFLGHSVKQDCATIQSY